jgi:hypothetical protein
VSDDINDGDGEAQLKRLKKATKALDAAQQASKTTVKEVSRAQRAVTKAKKDAAIITSGRKTKYLPRKKKH